MGKNLWLLLCVCLSVIVLVNRVEARAAFENDDDDWFTSEEKEKAPVVTQPPAAATTTTATAPTTQAPKSEPESAPAPLPAPKSSSFGSSNNASVPSGSSGGGFQSSNAEALIGRYNDTCGHTEYTRRCDRAKDMICSTSSNRCICDDQQTGRNFVYVQKLDKCLEISARSTDFSCKGHEQCHNGPLGQYSFCDESTERCECLPQFANTDVIRKDDKCFLKKRLGDFCENDEQCDAPISGKAVCIYPPQDHEGPGIHVIPTNQTMQCLCDEGYIFDNSPQSDLRECLKKGTQNSECKTDVQCTSSMGTLSRCYEQRCECKDVISGKHDTVYYQGRCHIKRELGGTCDTDIECQASIHSNAECAKKPSYQANDKVCICPEGKSCEKSGAALNVMFSLYLMVFGLIATKVIL